MTGSILRAAAPLALAVLSATQANAWIPTTTSSRRARGRTTRMSADPQMVSVPIPGLDGRETTLRRPEVDMLNEVREILPGEGLGVGGTHVVFLPGKGQDPTAFDTALGSLGVLGLHAMCADMPAGRWQETEARIKSTVSAIKEHLRDKMGKTSKRSDGKGAADQRRAKEKAMIQENWIKLFDNEMLSWSLHPVFNQLEQESASAGLPACDHLLLVGCEDGAWVLQAFMCELNRLGLKPRLEITMVALGSKSDTLIAKAVQAVYPDRLNNVRYLSIHGALPSRPAEEEGDLDENLVGLNALDDKEKDQILEEDLAASDYYGYGYSQEAMTCLTSIDGFTEECILSSPGTGEEGSIESWYSAPATIVRWIVKCIL